MSGMQWAVRITGVLGVLSLLSMGIGHLALVDIQRCEGDLDGEWLALQASAALILAFHGVALWTLARIERTMRRP